MACITRAAPWNLLVQARPGRGGTIRELLCDLGRVRTAEREDCYLLFAEDPVRALQTLQLWRRFNPAIGEAIERVVPLTAVFDYGSDAELEKRISARVRDWGSRLAGRSVRVRAEDDGSGCTGSSAIGEMLDRLLVGAGVTRIVTGGRSDVVLSFAGASTGRDCRCGRGNSCSACRNWDSTVTGRRRQREPVPSAPAAARSRVSVPVRSR